MPTRIDTLRSELEFVRAALVPLAEIEDGEYTDDQQRAWDEGLAYIAEDSPARTELAALEAREQQRADLLALVSFNPDVEVPADQRSFNVNTEITKDPHDISALRPYERGFDADIRARALQAVEKGEGWIRDEHRENATRILERLGNDNHSAEVILNGSAPAYRSAFMKAASEAAGNHEEWSPAEREADQRAQQAIRESGFFQPANEAEAQRALALTNITGKLVPAQLDTAIMISNNGTLNPIRQLARVENVSTNVWTGISTAGVTAEWVGAEGTAVADATPTFSNPAVTCYMADAWVPISFQGYEDWGRAANELEVLFMDAKDRLEAAAFATGSGSNQPFGVVTSLVGTSSNLFCATNNAFTITDFYTLYEALPPRWRAKQSTAWAMNVSYLDRIRQFATANNYHAFTVDLTAEGIPQTFGRKLYETPDMSGTLSTGTNNAIVFGDWSQYLIADRVGQVTEFVPQVFSVTTGTPRGQRGWLTHWRTGADVLVKPGLRLLTNQNTAATGTGF